MVSQNMGMFLFACVWPSAYFLHHFFEKYSHSLNSDIETYYSIFPEEINACNEEILRTMLTGNSIFERNQTLILRLVDDGLVLPEHAATINEMTCLIYQSMLSRAISGEETLPHDQLTQKMCRFALYAIQSCESDRIAPYVQDLKI